jgi:hypothetical protein
MNRFVLRLVLLVLGLVSVVRGQTIGGFTPFSPTGALTRNALVAVTNSTGQPASCLVLSLSSGGALALPSANVVAPGCPTPTVQVQGAQITINWGGPCVPNGATVYLIVQSSRGRMLRPGQTVASLYASLLVGFVGGFWTDGNGNNTGNLTTGGGPNNVVIVDLGGNGPGMGPCVITFSISYVPQGPSVCGPLMPPMGQQRCWTKKCWTTAADCLLTIRKNGVPLFSNLPTGFSLPPMEICLRVTNPPDMPEEPGSVQLPIQGAVADETPFSVLGASFASYNTPSGHRLQVFRTNAVGAIGAVRDLAVRFDEIYHALELVTDVFNPNDPVDGSYAHMIAVFGPRYLDVAQRLGDMAVFLGNEQQATGDARYGSLAISAQAMQAALVAIGNSMIQGSVTASQPFADLESALLAFGSTIATFAPVPSESHANANLIAMANGVRRAKERVIDVLDDPLEQDIFLFGMQNRFNTMFRHLADSLTPHARLKVDLGARGWFASTMQGLLVRVQDAGTDQLLETRLARLSDRNEFDVGAHPGRSLRVWFKAPGYLSEVVTVGVDSIQADAGLLRCGDADGDNDVDLHDLDVVLRDQGAGGLLATAVPCSDVNADGVVDLVDLQIVWNNLGQVGAVLPNL